MAKKETWDISGVLKWVLSLRKREMWPSCIISVSLYSWSRRVYCMPLVSGIFDCCNVSNPFLPIFAHFRYWHRSSLLELLSLSCSKSASHSSGAMKWWVMRNGETQINHPSFCCVVLELFFFLLFFWKHRVSCSSCCRRGQLELKTKPTSVLRAWCLTDLPLGVGKATIALQNKDLFLPIL